VDFYDHVKPQDFEEHIRGELVKQLKNLCRDNYYDAEVYPFGSFPSGLYLPTGDLDLVLCSDSVMEGNYPKYSNSKSLWALKAMLINSGVARNNDIEVIAKARVPLVKFIDSRTGLKVDVSFENLTGINAIKTFLAWKQQYPAMPVVVTLIKHFLAMRGLNEPVNGGIGGFSVICLVVSLLQHRPDVQSRSMNPEHHYGDILMDFFDFYGNRFNYRTTAISLNPPAYIPKVSATFPFSRLFLCSLCLFSPRTALWASRIRTKIACRSLIPTTIRTTSREDRQISQRSRPSSLKPTVIYGRGWPGWPELTMPPSEERAS